MTLHDLHIHDILLSNHGTVDRKHADTQINDTVCKSHQKHLVAGFEDHVDNLNSSEEQCEGHLW